MLLPGSGRNRGCTRLYKTGLGLSRRRLEEQCPRAQGKKQEFLKGSKELELQSLLDSGLLSAEHIVNFSRQFRAPGVELAAG